MHRIAALAAAVFILVTGFAAFAASETPDLKGTWIMKIESIGHDKLKGSPPVIHSEKMGIHDLELTLVIDKQEGARFSGYRESKRQKEMISGVVGFDNKSIYIVDDDGMNIATLVAPDKMESIYLHNTQHHSIVSRAIVTRKR